ncbi:hypothetical protein HY490_01725 [Candidatus Woesearchaeota archaeon]|nr:hypothetical protein [Candidatus Woesearchaeota archaeon]
MCFTPYISLLIAIIEFGLVAVMLLFFRRTLFRNLSAMFIFLLGVYQFTEFMLCSSGNVEIWGRLGFVAYSFLPALALLASLRFCNIKIHEILLYPVPVVFSLLALLLPDFILGGKCYGSYVDVKLLLFQPALNVGFIPGMVYWGYYFSFIFLACYLLYRNYRTATKARREIDVIEVIGVLIMFVPTLTLILIFPALSSAFPSILCKFAFLLAIAAFIGAYLEGGLR